MRQILYISMSIPYDNIPHAGGKTFNYYINKMSSEETAEVTMIAKVLPQETDKIGLIKPNINKLLVKAPDNKVKKLIACVRSLNSKLNPFYKYGNVLTKDIYDQIEKILSGLRKNDYQPDAVVLEWTWMLLFVDTVKKYFPKAVYIASEHDVSFLGAERMYKNARGFNKLIKRIYFQNLKSREIECINKCNLVFTHNRKDKRILLNNGIVESKLDTITPYYEDNKNLPWKPVIGNVIFYGAMNRTENESAALWFIDKVMPLLKDYNVRFTVIGNRPSQKLLDRVNDSIEVTGFVENPDIYFEKAMCMAAPLSLGAGVKVKIIECMSAGIPVITNNIGIEGIDAKRNVHYLHADTPEQYAKYIIDMLNGKIDINALSNNARTFINDQYNLEKSYDNYKKDIFGLIERNQLSRDEEHLK